MTKINDILEAYHKDVLTSDEAIKKIEAEVKPKESSSSWMGWFKGRHEKVEQAPIKRVEKKRKHKTSGKRPRMTPDEVYSAKQLSSMGLTPAEISKKLKRPYSTIYALLHYRSG